ncbi:hypothetical protein [Paracoccus pacificus]|uniref:Uncharacterized protein n=1 Tax=Paracoccus pacificus TaxID=1463598 RepID=A0ABW4R5Y4_9RHOB
MSDSQGKATPGNGSPPPGGTQPNLWMITGVMPNRREGREPTISMLRVDTSKYQQWKGPPFLPPAQQPQTPSAPWSPMLGTSKDQKFDPYSIPGLQSYVQPMGWNYLVPPSKEEEKEEEKADEKKDPKWEFGQAEKSAKGRDDFLGRRQAGIREYIKSGYTRRNPSDMFRDNLGEDFAKKWKETDYTIAEVSKELWDTGDVKKTSVASGTFGNADSFFAGSGAVLGYGSKGKLKGAVTSKGVEGEISGTAEAYALKGNATMNKDGLVSAEAEAAVLRAQAEGKGEVKLTAEEATLTGKLSASANVVEGKIGGEIALTPTRITRGAAKLINRLFDTNLEGLNDDWDFGIVLNGEVSGAVGAQAEAHAQGGYKKGKLRAEAGAKLGLGVGLGAKAGGGLTGLDKLWNLIKPTPGTGASLQQSGGGGYGNGSWGGFSGKGAGGSW